MCNYSRTLSTTMAYLSGVSNERLIRIYSPTNNELLIELRENASATLIRTLSMIRTSAIKHYDTFSLSSYPKSQLKVFENADISIPENGSTDECIILLNRAIYENINNCRNLFPEDFNWQNVYDLFVIKGCVRKTKNSAEVIKTEVQKYKLNSNLYPFQVYIHWKPFDCGNMFDNDRKLCKILGSSYTDTPQKPQESLVQKEDLYTLIQNLVADPIYTVMAVDCENTDPYKLLSALIGLPSSIKHKILKIKLFTDANIPAEWKLFEKQCGFPTELYPAKRVIDHKSTVDILLATEVSREYFAGKTESFIIVSSDSDYLPVITSLNNAHFLMMTEDAKCSEKTKDMLKTAGAVYCSLDDFPAADLSAYKQAVLRYCLSERIDTFNKSGVLSALDYNEIMNSITEQCRITLTDEERRNFINRYLMKLSLNIDNDDNYYIEIPA